MRTALNVELVELRVKENAWDGNIRKAQKELHSNRARGSSAGRGIMPPATSIFDQFHVLRGVLVARGIMPLLHTLKKNDKIVTQIRR